ncbi:MAG: hypothetical protein WD381_07060 [Balneolaceae bacterium]
MKLSVLLLIGCLCISCSPEPVLRLKAEDFEQEKKDFTIYQGIEYLYSEKEESTVLLSYYRHIGDRVIMDLEVSNDSDEMIRFDPGSNITFQASEEQFVRKHLGDNDWVLEQEMQKVDEGSADDPERIMLDIDRKASRASANNRTSNVMEGISASMTAISDVSSINESDEEQIARQNRKTHQAIRRAERRENFYRQASNLNAKRQYWETETVRITDLFSGESISGEVSLPVSPDATHINISVKVGDEVHQFNFRQHQFIP